MAPQLGTVKFFNRVKGYGLIAPDNGGHDIFVHFSDAKRSGVFPIRDGMRLLFDVAPDEKRDGLKAVDLKEPDFDLPQQGPGPHFRIDADALIDFDAVPTLDARGNNIPRLRSLHPVIIDTCQQLSACIRPNEQQQLLKIVRGYFDTINNDVEEIDYARLYGFGLRLTNASTAAKRQIADRLLPPLEDDAEEALNTCLVALHGPFMLSTSVGNDLLAYYERYCREPKQEKQNALAREFVSALQNDGDILSASVMDFIEGISNSEFNDIDDERTGAYHFITLKNISLVLVAGAAIGTVAGTITAAFFGSTAGLVVGAVAVLLGNEGLKKSKPFIALQEKITNAVNHANDIDLGILAKQLEPFKRFVLRNEDLLRRWAGENPGF